MKTLPVLLLISASTLFAANTSAKYSVEHSFLGKMANAYVNKNINNDLYTIELSIQTTDLAASLSNNLVKRFISQGTIKDGQFVPDVLTVSRHNDVEERYVVYQFDHQLKQLQIDTSSKKILTNRVLDAMSLSFSETKQIEYAHDSHQSATYVRNDIISLFFNAKSYISTLDNSDGTVILAAGIDDDDEDDIDGILGFGISNRDMQDMIHSSIKNDLITVTLSEKIFESKDKSLIIDINPDTLPQNVQLNDVAFGDINIKRLFDNVGQLSR